LYLFITSFFFLFTPAAALYALSLHDALPICRALRGAHAMHAAQDALARAGVGQAGLRQVLVGHGQVIELVALLVEHAAHAVFERSEEHTSELQSRENLVCRLLLEKKKYK